MLNFQYVCGNMAREGVNLQMRKRNIIKRNSGFILACVIAGGASFLGADTVLNELYQRRTMPEPEEETAPVQAETEKPSGNLAETYETDPFTITASGAVLNQVDSETMAAQPEEAESETESTESGEETGLPGNQEGAEETLHNAAGENESGADGSGLEENGTSDGNGSYDGSWSPDDGSGGDTGTGDGGYDQGWIAEDNGYEDSWTAENTGGSWTGDGNSADSGSSWDTGLGGGVEIIDPGDSTYEENGGWTDGTGGTGDGAGDAGIQSPDDLILWGINARYISEEELYPFDAATIRLIRNEIFALHGRIFRSEDLQAYFSTKSWYVPTYEPDEFDANMESFLNDYERANLNVILAYEAALNG